VGGGIAPKILAKLRESAFMDAFKSKADWLALLQDIPVSRDH